MNTDRDLWDLLGRAPRPPAPPFFAAKVMRQIGAADRPPWFAAVLRWFAPATVAALLLLAVLPRPEPAAAPADDAEMTTLELVEMLSPDDYETLTAAGWPYDNGFLSASL